MKGAMKIFIVGLLVDFPVLGEVIISSRPDFLLSETLLQLEKVRPVQVLEARLPWEGTVILAEPARKIGLLVVSMIETSVRGSGLLFRLVEVVCAWMLLQSILCGL